MLLLVSDRLVHLETHRYMSSPIVRPEIQLLQPNIYTNLPNDVTRTAPLLLSVLMTMLPLAAPAGCFPLRPSDRFQGLSKRARLNPTPSSLSASLIFSIFSERLTVTIPYSQLSSPRLYILLLLYLYERAIQRLSRQAGSPFLFPLEYRLITGRAVVGCGLSALFACPQSTYNTSDRCLACSPPVHPAVRSTYKILTCPARPSACAGD